MRRVCIIGNSHVKCWKAGWHDLRSEAPPGFEVTFYGAILEHLENMVYAGGRFVGRDDEGRTALKRLSGREFIDPAQYDAFILVGVGLNFASLLTASRQFGTLRQRRLRKTRHLVSEACFKAMLSDMYGLHSPALRLARRLRKVSSAPIILVPAPCPRAAREDRVAFAGNLYARFLRHLRRVVAKSRITLLEQDPRTMAVPGYTASTFAIDRPSDRSHMNADFGRIMVTGALDLLKVPGDPRGAATAEKR